MRGAGFSSQSHVLFRIFHTFLWNSHKYGLGSLRKTPHRRHSTYRPRSHKRTFGFKTYNQPWFWNSSQNDLIEKKWRKRKQFFPLFSLLQKPSPTKLNLDLDGNKPVKKNITCYHIFTTGHQPRIHRLCGYFILFYFVLAFLRPFFSFL